MLDWNDLRYFLAVARQGSTLAASRTLRVSQATVSRRVTALEEAAGAQLFERRQAGYALTPRGQAMVPAAEQVEAAVLAFANRIEADNRALSGAIRFTTVESAANEWVLPAISSFRTRHPGVRIDVLTSDSYIDLARGDADVALRFGPMPEQESLIVRHVVDLENTVYASRSYIAAHGKPETAEDLNRHAVVLMANDNPGPMAQWIAQIAPQAEVSHRANTLMGVFTAVKAGLGVSILPCLMGDDDRNLVRCLPPIEQFTTPGWLVTTDPARRQPHIRAFLDHLMERIEAEIARLTSRADG